MGTRVPVSIPVGYSGFLIPRSPSTSHCFDKKDVQLVGICLFQSYDHSMDVIYIDRVSLPMHLFAGIC